MNKIDLTIVPEEKKKADEKGQYDDGILRKYEKYELKDVENSQEEEEDEDVERQRKDNEYRDDLIFDALRDKLPSGKDGSRFMLWYLCVQAAMIVLLFYGFHHRNGDFDCCNMWAVTVAICFLAAQFFYYIDWLSIDGDNPAWHRSSLFVPAVSYIGIFIAWGAGIAGMLARAIGINLFDAKFSDLSPFEQTSLIICNIIGIILAALMLVIPYVHRNNLGPYYYLQDEEPNALVELSDFPVPVQGSFHFRGILFQLARLLKVETSKKAEANLPKLILLVAVLQFPFYFFLAGTYYSGDKSKIPLCFLGLGGVFALLTVKYAIGAFKARNKKTRKWNRANMYFLYAGIYIGFAAYVFTISSVFFKSTDSTTHKTSELWGDVWRDLDGKEKLVGVITTGFLLFLLGLTMLLCNMHRKGWCDGQRDLEWMIQNLKKQEAREAQMEQKRAIRLEKLRREMEAEQASGTPKTAAKQAPRAVKFQFDEESGPRKIDFAPPPPEQSETDVSFSESSNRVSRKAKLVPIDQRFNSIEEDQEEDDYVQDLDD